MAKGSGSRGGPRAWTLCPTPREGRRERGAVELSAGTDRHRPRSAEGNILLHLFTQGQEIGQDQLVEQLDVSKAAVSRALASLEGKGYAIRQRDPDDKRAYRIQLTDKALETGPVIEQIYNHVYTLATLGISQAELDDFLTLFARMSKNLARTGNKAGHKV